MDSATGLTKRQVRRLSRLADVAEMYFLKKMTQKQIAERIGSTPSNVSRMLSDAERQGIVRISISRPMSNDQPLGEELRARLGLAEARVVVADDRDAQHLSRQVAQAGADMLRGVLRPGVNIGVTWGRTLQAIIDAFGEPVDVQGQVIQLAGSIGAVEREFDSVSLVQRLAAMTNSKAIHLSSPFVVERPDIAESLRRNVSNKQSHQLASDCDVIVVGIGSVDPEQSSLFASGFLTEEEIAEIRAAGAIGEICGHPIGRDGQAVAPDFSSRVVTVGFETLRRTPVKIAAAARANLAAPIIAAAKAGYISHLAVDVGTANELLSQA